MDNTQPENSTRKAKLGGRDKMMGRLIRNLRKAAEISQWDLANATGISQAKLSLFESGHRGVERDDLTLITDTIHSFITDRWVYLRGKQGFCTAADAWIMFLCEELSPQAQKELHVDRGWPNAFSASLAERHNPTVHEEEVKMLNMMRKVALRKKADDLERELAKIKAQIAEL